MAFESGIKTLEIQYKANYDKWLNHILAYVWQDINVFRRVSDQYDRVYGISSGLKDPIGTADFIIKGLITGNDFAKIDAYAASFLSQAFLFTTSINVKPGDTISIVRNDNRSVRFKVEPEEANGMQDTVVKRFILSALGD